MRCEDKKWRTFLSSAVDLGSKEFTVAAVKSSVHAAVAGDKDSADSEAHPSFYLRWWPCFRMLCGFEVPHLQDGASVARGEAVAIMERIILASRWSSSACYFVAHTFLVFQWISKGLLRYYNASVCVSLCGILPLPCAANPSGMADATLSFVSSWVIPHQRCDWDRERQRGNKKITPWSHLLQIFPEEGLESPCSRDENLQRPMPCKPQSPRLQLHIFGAYW